MGEHAGENLRRLMAERGLSIKDLIEMSGMDRRTLGGILAGTLRTHPRTINRLAKSLGVSSDEFFVTPTQLLYRRFDTQTNAAVEEVVDDHPELFDGWTDADFDELHSRFGAGGALTAEGTLEAARSMNRKRELHDKLALLLESSQQKLVGEILESLYRQVTLSE
ncbi:MAG: helix-turn-helix transcriptional regulator [Planctomycetota bacterium]|nr:helix-turn-helix transcriptional regulator [Planctomycetota bacterium]